MIHLKYKYHIVCEFMKTKNGRTYGCTCDEIIEEHSHQVYQSPSFFEDLAKSELIQKGWNINPQLCPEHNTKTNRKKKFKQAEKGSLADLIRNSN